MVDKNSFSDKEILDSLKEIIGSILMLEPDEIAANSSLVDNLGLESIDFLDIVFQLEEKYDIAVPRRNPIQRIEASLGEEELIQGGKLTRKGAKLLKIVFPEVEPSRIYEGMQESEIPSLLTVQTYVNVVKRGLEVAHWQPEQCDKCGAENLVLGDKDKLEFPNDVMPFGPVFLCKACDNMMIAPSFDDLIYEKASE